MGDDGGPGLPPALSSFIGRDAEIEAVLGQVAAERMVTLVGAGGTGKTRLALAAAARVQEAFADGVRWADLSTVTREGLLSGVVAGAMGVPQSPGEDSSVALARHVERKTALLVLDNCEHVVEECAWLCDHLLRASPGLRILATSREVIGVSGERVFPMGGLRLPRPGQDPATSEAVQLFAARAASAGAELDVRSADGDPVARICQRLDGLPLAIELAAAKVTALGLVQIADRLGDDSIFRHPSRSAPARHRTLQATLEWSYQLLTPDEQALFRRLAVFRGSFSLRAVEAICAGQDIEPGRVATLLGNLVNKSLVQVDSGPVEHRYRLLQVVCHHAETILRESGEAGRVLDAYARFFTSLAEQAYRGLEGADQLHWLEKLEIEHDNFRALLRRRLPSDPEAGGRVAALLWPFWYRRGFYQEARAWLEQAASLEAAMSPSVRAATLTGAGVLAFLQCDYTIARERLNRARSFYDRSGDKVGVATVLQRLGSIAREQGRYDQATRMHWASMAIWEELDDGAGVAASEDYLGIVAWLTGNPEQAAERCARAFAYFRRHELRQEAAEALINLGIAAHYQHDDVAAQEKLDEALRVSRELHYQEGVAWSLHELGTIGLEKDPHAADLLREALNVHFELGDRWRTAATLETIAAALVVPDPGAATTLLAATHVAREAMGAPVAPAELPLVRSSLAAVIDRLDKASFDRAWSTGMAMSLSDAVDLATRSIQVGRSQDPEDGAASAHGLTDREVAVLCLIREGLTNRQIGQRLFISPATAGVHVSNILRKLDVTSRVQAAGIAHDLHL